MYTSAVDPHFFLSGGRLHRWHNTDIFHYFQFTLLKAMANLITRLGLDASIFFPQGYSKRTALFQIQLDKETRSEDNNKKKPLVVIA